MMFSAVVLLNCYVHWDLDLVNPDGCFQADLKPVGEISVNFWISELRLGLLRCWFKWQFSNSVMINWHGNVAWQFIHCRSPTVFLLHERSGSVSSPSSERQICAAFLIRCAHFCKAILKAATNPRLVCVQRKAASFSYSVRTFLQSNFESCHKPKTCVCPAQGGFVENTLRCCQVIFSGYEIFSKLSQRFHFPLFIVAICPVAANKDKGELVLSFYCSQVYIRHKTTICGIGMGEHQTTFTVHSRGKRECICSCSFPVKAESFQQFWE